MIDMKRLTEIEKTWADSTLGYASVNNSVYSRDVSFLLEDRKNLLLEIAEQKKEITTMMLNRQEMTEYIKDIHKTLGIVDDKRGVFVKLKGHEGNRE